MPSPATAPGRSSSGLRGLRRVSTPRSVAEDGQVTDVDHEALLARGAARRAARARQGQPRSTRVAIPADQVEVLVVGDGVVRRGAVGQVRVAHQAELLEHLEGAVDRRDVDRARRAAAPRRSTSSGVAWPSFSTRPQDELRAAG